MKLRILAEKLLVIPQQFFGIPPFRYYALAAGIRRHLSGSAFQPRQESAPDPPLELALLWTGWDFWREPGTLLCRSCG
jgi:hypothetical protein